MEPKSTDIRVCPVPGERSYRTQALDAGITRDYPGGYTSYDAHRGRGKGLTIRPLAPPPPRAKGRPARVRA